MAKSAGAKAPKKESTRVFEVEVNHSIREITIRRIDGSLPPLVFHAARAHADCAVMAQMLGFKNTIVDTAALSRDADGNPASPDAKYAQMLERINKLESGEASAWTARAARASSTDDARLVSALMEVLGSDDRAKITAILKSWTQEKRDALRLREDVKAILERMAVESAKDVDTEALMEELMSS